MRSFLFAATVGIVALGTIQLCGPAALAQGQQQALPRLQALSPSSRNALTSWLRRDCSVGLTGDAATSLIAIPGVDEAVLIEAYERGPAPDLERTFQEAFSRAYDDRGAVLAQEGDALLGKEDTAILRGVNRDAYVARRLEAARINYRTNAVHGLGAVGSPRALGVLDQVATDSASALSAAARSAAQAIRSRAAQK